MQISALEVWHVNNEENNSQMCSLESGSADENIETMKAYMCKQRGMHLGSKISREEITKKVNQSKYEKYCYITNRLRREQFPLGLFKYFSKIENYICSILCIRYIFWKVIRLYWQYQKGELSERGEQMDTAQRIRLIRMIEKIEKNPEFSSKIGVRNTSEFVSSKQSKKWMIQIITGVRRSRICYRYYLLYAWSGLLENFLYLV